jgi:hypothetical protein
VQLSFYKHVDIFEQLDNTRDWTINKTSSSFHYIIYLLTRIRKSLRKWNVCI